ncbi:MAG TPA: GGDEF domain-containing protein [Aromatoleum sp.]|uniref:GGDEF domain-containing protein n=1 Tax=Aromatoleum sp. TaxID=2307007 RepID=UPI002B461349|nr:GGDEF domain-containing protein [Aromatoleum sp.]HJV24719.1 GGDEF domain-containing protein [Aromatoleum sp.]
MANGPAENSSVLRRLLALARDFLQASDLPGVLELAGQAVSELLRSDGSLLVVQDGEREYVIELGNRKGLSPAPDSSELLIHARRAIADRTPILLPEMAPEGGADDKKLSAPSVASLIAYPFPPGRPLGALVSVWYRQGQREELARLIPALRLLGEITGAALGNIGFRQSLEDRIVAKTEELAEATRVHAVELLRRDSLEEDIHRIAVTDVMTGLLNRRGFFLHAERSIKLARRQQVQAALVFVDIDGLKTANDTYGHDVGDHLIEDTAQILQDCFRDADVIARIGGDEFAVFTIDAAHPEVLLARIRDSLADFAARSDSPYRISLSTGIVECDPASEASLLDRLRQADRLMYEQKRKPIPDS